jgi:hypothetical protein
MRSTFSVDSVVTTSTKTRDITNGLVLSLLSSGQLGHQGVGCAPAQSRVIQPYKTH